MESRKIIQPVTVERYARLTQQARLDATRLLTEHTDALAADAAMLDQRQAASAKSREDLTAAEATTLAASRDLAERMAALVELRAEGRAVRELIDRARRDNTKAQQDLDRLTDKREKIQQARADLAYIEQVDRDVRAAYVAAKARVKKNWRQFEGQCATLTRVGQPTADLTSPHTVIRAHQIMRSDPKVDAVRHAS